MIYPARKKNVLSYVFIPLLGVLLFVGIFALVRLRSSVVSMEYRIGEIERQKFEAVKEIKALEADMASLLSIGRVGDTGFLFPERKKVIYVKRDKGGGPYMASFRKN